MQNMKISNNMGHMLVTVPNSQEECDVPDSTTADTQHIVQRCSEFYKGQDILLKHRDGRYYLGTVVTIDNDCERCLVKFDDNTEHWATYKDLMKLGSDTGDKPVIYCVVCQKAAHEDVVICSQCDQGYHGDCHHPPVLHSTQSWTCYKCSKRNVGVESRAEASRVDGLNLCQLPYDLTSLTWDNCHRTNTEQLYCYCGQSGDWRYHMLQCCCCRQWFHSDCVQCLRRPLYAGDRFYIFECGVCHQRRYPANRTDLKYEEVEFLRRLELKWVDLVHLVLFNLTFFNCRKYFDLDLVLLPYMQDNWNALQLPPKIEECPPEKRREHVLNALVSNRNRFKCGRERHKHRTVWGLRLQLPPPVPCVSLPTDGPLTDAILSASGLGNRRLRFLACLPPKSTLFMGGSVVTHDMLFSELVQGIMHGNSFQESKIIDSDSDDFDNDGERKSFNCLDMNVSSGSVVNTVSPRKQKKRIFTKRDKILRKCRNSDRNRNSNDNDGYPKLNRFSVNSLSTLSNPQTDYSDCGKLVGSSDQLDLRCDTSGDETSSKSTLDLIIPPLKNIGGKNNPLIALLFGDKPGKDSDKHISSSLITLPLPLKGVIPASRTRALKRQLSEKDICIGPNGEVKRRRFRRCRSSSSSNNQPIDVIVPKSRHLVGEKLNSSRNINHKLKGIHDFYEKCDEDISINPIQKTPTSSPVKHDVELNLDDLKESVNSYFGTAMRIAAGEKYTVKARRLGPSGQEQYLIEWESNRPSFPESGIKSQYFIMKP